MERLEEEKSQQYVFIFVAPQVKNTKLFWNHLLKTDKCHNLQGLTNILKAIEFFHSQQNLFVFSLALIDGPRGGLEKATQHYL